MAKIKKFLIIDANSLIHRAYHALPPLTTKDGRLVNAVYGFTNIFLKVLREIKPDYVAVAFDVAGGTFRDEIYKEYKAGRKKKPQEFYDQFEIIKNLLSAFNVKTFEKQGFEADDIIGSLTQNTTKKGAKLHKNIKNIILSGDLDLLQLVNEDTEVETVKKGVSETLTYTTQGVKERYGLMPEQMIDYKALRGDPSDNILGVPGIGEKTATELIKKFRSLEKLYEYVEGQKNRKTPSLVLTKVGTTAGRQKHLTKRHTELVSASKILKRVQGNKSKIKESILNKLIEHKKQAFLSKKLVTIKRDVPIKFKLNDVEVKLINYDKAIKIIQDLGFKSLLNRLPHPLDAELSGEAGGPKPETPSLFEQNKELSKGHPEFISGSNKTLKQVQSGTLGQAQGDKQRGKTNYILVDTEEKFKKFLTKLKNQKIFAIDTETNQEEIVGAELVGMSFSWQAATGFYLPLTHKNIKIKKQKNNSYAELISRSNKALKRIHGGNNLKSYNLQLTTILEDTRIKKVGHNIKYDYQVFKQAGINLEGIEFDSMIASYLLNPGSRSHSLSNLAFQEFGTRMIPIESLIGKKGKDQKNMTEVPVKQAAEYAAEDADLTWRLYKKFSKDKNLKHLDKVFNQIEMPLVVILGDMELAGIKLNVKLLKSLSKKLEIRNKKLEIKIHKLAGKKFNVASPVQLKEILFQRLKISTEGLSRTKTGISTSAQNLEKLKNRHNIIESIVEFRELSKLKNTYTDALPELVNSDTGRVHTSFNQTITATGRLSSSNPNLQNIPIRTDLGMEIRKAFVAEHDFKLLSADYSQIELRMVASLADDKKMLESFKKGEDIHQRTAAEVYNTPLNKVTRQERREAKEVNFGILYGLGPRGISLRAQIPYEQAKEFYQRYFDLHPQIKDYIKTIIQTTRQLGYAETFFGRRRYFPEIDSGHPMLRSQAERAAINLPIQGTAADLIKLAMINVTQEIKNLGLQKDIKMLLQVHDELLFEVKESKIKIASKLIKEIMENVVKLKAPIEVHVGVGNNWGECK